MNYKKRPAISIGETVTVTFPNDEHGNRSIYGEVIDKPFKNAKWESAWVIQVKNTYIYSGKERKSGSICSIHEPCTVTRVLTEQELEY